MFTAAAGGPHSRHKRHNERTVNSSVGHTTVLPCNVTKPPVFWKRTQQQTAEKPTPVDQTIVDNGEVINGFNARFYLKVTAHGAHNLVIRNTEMSDGGTYECIEDGGIGSKHIVTLIILGEHLSFRRLMKWASHI
jgi:hypothetical protein